jgi:hypothetical protein
MAELALLSLINEQLRRRGPLLLPRFGGSRRIIGIFRWDEAFVLCSEQWEIRLLVPWELPQLGLSLGLLSPHVPSDRHP